MKRFLCASAILFLPLLLAHVHQIQRVDTLLERNALLHGLAPLLQAI